MANLNTFKTSQKTELVALRAAEAMNYLTVGSKKYFKDQLKHKRNGQTYQFVITDAGEYQRGMDLTAGQNDSASQGCSVLKEKVVSKSLKFGNVLIATNLIEPITDADWDKEVAIKQGPTLGNGVVADAIYGTKGKKVDNVVNTVYDGDLGCQNTAFVGIGYGPLTAATNYLTSVTDDDQYMFIHPFINSKLSTTGDAFKPTSAEPIFSKGLIGKLGETEVRTNKFMPLVNIKSALVSDIANATAVAYAESGNNDGLATLTFTGMTEKFPRGSVVWFDGIYAAGLVGEYTSELKAFIAVEDSASGGVMIVKALSDDDWIGRATKIVCDENGDALGATKAAAITAFNTAASVAGAIQFPEAGKYYGGFVRSNGAMEFECVDEIDASNADTERADNAGLIIFQNRAIDPIKGSNVTRWTSSVMAGIVEPRGVVYVLVKEAPTNLVKQV